MKGKTMKSLSLSAAIVAAGLTLASCDDAQVAQLKQIQQQAILICGFVPDAISVATLIPGADIYAAPAGAVAQAICNAVSSVKLLRRGAGNAPVVVNVTVPGAGTAVVSGHFVR
jgi:hypothetical protein